MITSDATMDQVKQYYGKILTGKKDLKTNSCCSNEILPESHKALHVKIDHEILDRFYGCGSPIPPAIYGATVLDLGCGTVGPRRRTGAKEHRPVSARPVRRHHQQRRRLRLAPQALRQTAGR